MRTYVPPDLFRFVDTCGLQQKVDVVLKLRIGAEVIGYVQQSGGIEYATQKMNEYKRDAIAMLDKYPDSPAKEAMIALVNYAIERKY